MTLLRDETSSATRSPMSEPRVRYEDDAYAWSLQQAALLRAGRTDELDFANLADEIADVAGREYDKLESALVRVIQHLLKWDHRPERRSRSWALSIEEHRKRAAKQLRKHPGLRAELTAITCDAYAGGRYDALIETDLPEAALPETNPYPWEEIMGREIVWSET